MDTCTRCSTGTLSTFFESKLKLCADCVAHVVDRHAVIEPEMKILDSEVARLEDMLAEARGVLFAERMGLEASKKGFEESQNPYILAQAPAEHASWLSGWTHGELLRRTEQAISVISWAVDTLEIVNQIAEGNGQKEISDKIFLVMEKLHPFV